MVAAIVVMSRTEQTAEMLPKVKAEIDRMNHDGSLPPGVRLVPFYDRELVDRCHHAHRAAQSDLRLRAGLPDPVDVPGGPAQRDHRRGQHPVRAVLRDHPARAAGRKRQPAVGGRRGLRHHRGFGGHPRREHLPQFPDATGGETGPAAGAGGRLLRARPDAAAHDHSAGPRLDRPAAADSDQRAAGGQGGVLLGADHRRRIRAAVHHAGSRGADLRARWRALTATPWRGR